MGGLGGRGWVGGLGGRAGWEGWVGGLGGRAGWEGWVGRERKCSNVQCNAGLLWQLSWWSICRLVRKMSRVQVLPEAAHFFFGENELLLGVVGLLLCLYK